MTTRPEDLALFARPFIYLRHGETESNVAEPEEPIGNCTPLRFLPPAPGFRIWRVEAIAG